MATAAPGTIFNGTSWVAPTPQPIAASNTAPPAQGANPAQPVNSNGGPATTPQSAANSTSTAWTQPGLIGGQTNNTSVVTPGAGNTGSYGGAAPTTTNIPAGSGTVATPTSPTNTLTSSGATNDLSTTAGIIAQEQANLQSDYNNSTATANADFAQAQQNLNQTQTSENGTNAASEFRLGQTGSSYAVAANQKLDQLHTQQQTALYTQRQSALNAAQKAFSDGDIGLAKELVQNAQDIAAQQLAAQKQAAVDKQQAATDAINATKAASTSQDDAINAITKLATNGITSLSDDQLSAFDKALGGTGMAKAIFNGAVTQATNKANLDFATALGKLPPGATVTRDGNTYTSTQAGKLTKVTEKAKDGTFTTVFYNADGTVHSTSQGQAGDGSSSSGSSSSSPDLTTPKGLKAATAIVNQQLASRADPTTGKISKEDWATALKAWEANKGTLKQFVAAFGDFANNAPGYQYEGMPIKSFKAGTGT